MCHTSALLDRLLCLFHAQYDTMYIMIIWPLPEVFTCRQLLKVQSACRRKNGCMQIYHYSKIHDAGDCVARAGVRDIGFKSGSLPHEVSHVCRRPRGISPLCFSSTRFIVGLCLLIKTSTWPRLRVQDLPGHHTTHSIAGPRLIVKISDALKYSFFPRTIPH